LETTAGDSLETHAHLVRALPDAAGQGSRLGVHGGETPTTGRATWKPSAARSVDASSLEPEAPTLDPQLLAGHMQRGIILLLSDSSGVQATELVRAKGSSCGALGNYRGRLKSSATSVTRNSSTIPSFFRVTSQPSRTWCGAVDS